MFGTPIAGAVFALEFVALSATELASIAPALVPALLAAVIGDDTTRAIGITHTSYPSALQMNLTPLLLLKWAVFAVAVALTASVFIELTHLIKQKSEKHLVRLPARMFVGGIAVLVLWKAVGVSDYLGLGVPMITRSFTDPTFPAYGFALKLLFTALTVGVGFLGGEVTPLFFIGAALGNIAARLLGIPIELGAGVGLAAVFAASANTPIALSIMAVEILGPSILPHVLIVCGMASLLMGKRSIYQRS